MRRSFLDPNSGGVLQFDDNPEHFSQSFSTEKDKRALLTVAWNEGADREIKIDGIMHQWRSGGILTLMSQQSFDLKDKRDICTWRFNKDFYCIIDHDKEVSCAGFLFYGWQHIMFINSDIDLIRKLKMLKQVFIDEFETSDTVQGEMLRMLLKRLIILLTRAAKSQMHGEKPREVEDFDLIRSFNLLVEQHYRTYHQVQDYAELLHKSPKTLSNLFKMYKVGSPLSLIQKRILLEAKRYLMYTDYSISEIADQLGFAEPTHFSRFFKTQTTQSPRVFKDSAQLKSLNTER
jgi:AraC-type DNA-binding domain-containing proteins